MTVVPLESCTNDVQTFSFGGLSLRALLLDGEPWFIAMDVAAALEYSESFKMTKRLDTDEIQNRQIGGFGNRGVNLINESGLYSAILGSHKPEAKAFKKWVTSEVLPAIRKTGEYSKPQSLEERSLALMGELAAEVQKQKLELETARPKVDAYHVFLDSDRLLHINFVAKKFKELGLHIGKEGFGGWLLSRGFLYDENANKVFKKKKKLRARTRWVRDGYLSEVDNSTDSYASYQVRVLPAGLFYFYELMCEEQGVTPAPHKTVLEVVESVEDLGMAA